VHRQREIYRAAKRHDRETDGKIRERKTGDKRDKGEAECYKHMERDKK
jgi:hypothetical protein